MKPRLSTSKKWTLFPGEYVEHIREALIDTFGELLESLAFDPENILVEGRIYAQEIIVRVSIEAQGRLAQPNFQSSVEYDPENGDAIDRIDFAIDTAATLIQEYLDKLVQATTEDITDPTQDLPIEWQQVEYYGKTAYIRYSTENSKLDAEADALLGLLTNDLVREEAEVDSEDALDRCELDFIETTEDVEDEMPFDHDFEHQDDLARN